MLSDNLLPDFASPRAMSHRWEVAPAELPGLSLRSLFAEGNLPAAGQTLQSFAGDGFATYLDFPARTESVARIRNAAAQAAWRVGFTPTDCDDIKLAVGEAANNAVCHCDLGEPDSESRTVRVWLLPSFDPCRPGLAVTLVNPGRFAPPTPTVAMPDPDDLSESGRGLALMHLLMDTVTVREWNGQTIVRMWKQRAANVSGPPA